MLSALSGPAGPPPGQPAGPTGPTGRDAAVAALQGLAGVGDAISAGYGGTKTDFLKTAMGAEQQAKENRMAEQKSGVEIAAAKKSAADIQSLQDPASTLSKRTQDSARPLLLAAGYKPDEIAKIPGGAIENVLKNAVSFADAKARLAELRFNKELALQGLQSGIKERHEALKAAHPLENMFGMFDDKGPAPTFEPDVVAYAKAHNISPGQAQAIKDARTKGRG